VAALLQTLILLGWMLRPAVDRVYQSRATWRPRWRLIRRMLRFGLPAGVQFSVDIAAFTVFTLLLVGRFGTTQLAAHNLVFKLLEVSFMPAVGMGMAVQAAVAKAIGAGDPALARRIVRWATGFTCGYMGVVAVGYLGFRYPLAHALTDSPEVVGYAVQLLLLCAVFQLFDAVGITHGHALQGAGDNRWQAIASATLVIGVLVGGGYAAAILRPEWGCLGPWAAATAYIITLGLTLWARWRFGPWESNRMLDEAPSLNSPAAAEISDGHAPSAH
jgi:MATE family multidrug resistance protein